MNSIIRGILRRFGIRISRSGLANRFQAMGETLALLRRMGYSPKVVIDCGANVGEWTRMCHAVFPESDFHLIEPQPGCVGDLQRLASGLGRLHIHPFAVTEPGVRTVRMSSGGPEDKSTGNHVASNDEAGNTIGATATTLDELFADRTRAEDRALLKLDLEGHEIKALQGAVRLLATVEVVLSEVQFFQINNNGFPTFTDLLIFLTERGFDFYDVACLTQRPRDMRLKMGDVVFVRRGSPLLSDSFWV